MFSMKRIVMISTLFFLFFVTHARADCISEGGIDITAQGVLDFNSSISQPKVCFLPQTNPGNTPPAMKFPYRMATKIYIPPSAKSLTAGSTTFFNAQCNADVYLVKNITANGNVKFQCIGRNYEGVSVGCGGSWSGTVSFAPGVMPYGGTVRMEFPCNVAQEKNIPFTGRFEYTSPQAGDFVDFSSAVNVTD